MRQRRRHDIRYGDWPKHRGVVRQIRERVDIWVYGVLADRVGPCGSVSGVLRARGRRDIPVQDEERGKEHVVRELVPLASEACDQSVEIQFPDVR